MTAASSPDFTHGAAELRALRTAYSAISSLSPDAQARALEWLAGRLKADAERRMEDAENAG